MQINVLDMRDAGKLFATNGAFRLSGGGYRLFAADIVKLEKKILAKL